MDLDEVKACLRALLSSTAFSYSLSNLLNDFKNMTGFDLPLFGCLHPVEFLRTLSDTVELFGDPYNPQVALVKSEKSAHITSLVDRQKNSSYKTKYPQFIFGQKRLIIPNRNEVTSSRDDRVFHFTATPHNNMKNLTASHSSTFFTPSKPNEFVSQLSSPLKQCDTVLHTTQTIEAMKNDASVPIKLYSDSVRSQDSPKQVEISSGEPLKDKKTGNCYFEDVSDVESLISAKESRPSSLATSSPCCYVNDGIQNKLKKLIKKYPEGLWCCELAALFLKEYDFVLDYREFGYTSLIQMLSELPDIFRCVRPGNEDWILFDASVPPSFEEKKMMDLQSTSEFNCEVRTNVQKILRNHVESTFESGVELDKMSELYKKTFGKNLDFESLGFKNLKSLFETWEGTLLNLLNINGKTIVTPALSKTPRPKVQWEEAVPPITEENDIFCEIFPKEVVGPEESLIELDLTQHVAVGHVIKVCVAEVWSPNKFYVQLNKFKSRLNRFMDDLQKFYGVYLNKYKMPDSTIRANQVCVGLYNSDPDYPDEWHRAQIVKVINEKMVLVNFVDYGTVTRVKKTQLRFLHRNFQFFPIQAFLAKLSGIVPPNNEKIWPVLTSKKFLEFLRVPSLDAEIVDIDFKKPSMSVVLYDSYIQPETNINERLVREKLAKMIKPLYENLPFLQDEEDEIKALGVNSSDLSVPESSNKNLPERTDAFSDIDDLTQPTLFHFKMKALKIEDSFLAEKEKENENEKPSGKLNVVFEFEEVPDLETNCEKECAAERKNKDIIKAKLTPPPPPPPPPPLPPLPPSPPPPCQKLSSPTSQLKTEKKSDLQFPQLKPFTAEPSSSSSVGKPKRCPPGLEHVTVPPNFEQIQFLLRPEDIRKRINVLALELLSTNPSIKQVGMIDPTLALKIAAEMAEAYVRSEYASKLPFGFPSVFVNPLINGFIQPAPSAYEARGPVVPVVPVMPVVPPVVKLPETPSSVTDTMNTTSSSEGNSVEVSPSKVKKKDTYVAKAKIGGKSVHLVVIHDQFYCGAEEIIRTFTLISNREVADRVLHIKKTPMEYKIVSKKTDETAYNAIKSSDIIVVKKNTKKMKFYLIPLNKVVGFLQTLGCHVKSFERDIVEILKTEGTKQEE